jgi:broad specificity phosphatase PhoE
MKKYFCGILLGYLLVNFNLWADFQQNHQIVRKLQKNNVRLIVLCNFESSDQALGIVTSSRSPAYELTERGIHKLEESVPALLTLNISHIYTSLNFSALQTTCLLGKALELRPFQLFPDPRLVVQDLKCLNGMSYSHYKHLFCSKLDMLESVLPGCEAGITVFNRTQNFLIHLTELENQTVLVVCHAFNFCHFSKCLTGDYGPLPLPGTFAIYDFSEMINF